MTRDVPPALPELGPYLGRLADPTRRFEYPSLGLDQIRLQLVTDLFELASSAREFLLIGDGEGARSALDRSVWLDAWRTTAARAADQTASAIEERLERAAERSGFPRRRLRGLLPTPVDRAALLAKLEAAGIPLEDRLARGFGSAGGEAWWDAVRLAATAVEDSWDQLEEVVRHELAGAEEEARRIERWRPSAAPKLAALGAAIAAAVWLGLVIGGFLPGPKWLDPLADWFWSLPWP